MKLLLFVGFLFSWILWFTKTTKIKIQQNTFFPIDLHVVFESTNSRTYWSMHFVETMDIGAIGQKTFHSTLFSGSVQGNRWKILLYLSIDMTVIYQRKLSHCVRLRQYAHFNSIICPLIYTFYTYTYPDHCVSYRWPDVEEICNKRFTANCYSYGYLK